MLYIYDKNSFAAWQSLTTNGIFTNDKGFTVAFKRTESYFWLHFASIQCRAMIGETSLLCAYSYAYQFINSFYL